MVHLGGQHSINNGEVKSAVNDWPKEMDTELYGSKIKKIFLRYQKCIDLDGDDVDKYFVVKINFFQHIYTFYFFFFEGRNLLLDCPSCIYIYNKILKLKKI